MGTNDIVQELRTLRFKRNALQRRLEEFRKVLFSPPEKLFAELCFCLCTPQSKAEVCDSAIRKLEERNLLMDGSWREIRATLRGVRFPNVKARRIVKARYLFSGTDAASTLATLSSGMDPSKLREWLVAAVEGLGMKEASHFLRNIGLGCELAILDRHILQSLLECGVIPHIPTHLSPKRYVEIEGMMKQFSRELDVPMEELDLLLWLRKTGRIFK